VVGTLSFVDNQVNESTGTITMKAIFQNESRHFAGQVYQCDDQPYDAGGCDRNTFPRGPDRPGRGLRLSVKPDSNGGIASGGAGCKDRRRSRNHKGARTWEIVVTEGHLRLIAPGIKVRINESSQRISGDGSDVSRK
jgi:hypothetical protein